VTIFGTSIVAAFARSWAGKAQISMWTAGSAAGAANQYRQVGHWRFTPYRSR
jgi:hypothetical protein